MSLYSLTLHCTARANQSFIQGAINSYVTSLKCILFALAEQMEGVVVSTEIQPFCPKLLKSELLQCYTFQHLLAFDKWRTVFPDCWNVKWDRF